MVSLTNRRGLEVVKFLSQQEETIQLRIVLMSKFRVLENTMEVTGNLISFGEGHVKVAIIVASLGGCSSWVPMFCWVSSKVVDAN
jgi:hypothetical protein